MRNRRRQYVCTHIPGHFLLLGLTSWQKATWGGKGFLGLSIPTTVHPWEKQRQGLMKGGVAQRPWKNTACSACLHIPSRTTCHEVAPPTVAGPSYPSIKTTPTDFPTGQSDVDIFSFDAPPPHRTLALVKLTKIKPTEEDLCAKGVRDKRVSDREGGSRERLWACT